jgi:DNA polymerase zeta
MIAYNLCYSTCLGNISDEIKNGEKRFGAKLNTSIDLENLLGRHKDWEGLKRDVFLTKNKVGFVRKHIREGIIPTILNEFLNTRIMIKDS